MFSDTHIYLDDTPAITPLQLRTKCRRLHMEFGIDLIIIDYLQLMGGDTRNDNRVQEVSLHLAQFEGAGARVECACAGCRTVIPRRGTAHR